MESIQPCTTWAPAVQLGKHYLLGKSGKKADKVQWSYLELNGAEWHPAI